MKIILFLILPIGILFMSCDSERIQSHSTINFVDIATISVDTLEIDMVGDANQNALYLAYSPNNDVNDNTMKLDLQTLSQTIEAHPDPTESRQLAILGNHLYSFGVDQVLKMDMDLNNLQVVNSGYSIFFYSRAVPNGNTVLFPFGQNDLVSYDILTDTYQGTIDFDPLTLRSDGAVMNNILYSFGGNPLSLNPMSDKIKMYDLITSSYSESNLPYPIYESFVTTYQGNFIVAGNKNTTQGDAFLAIYNPTTATYTDMNTSLNLSTISIRSISVVNDELYLAYCENFSPTASVNTIKIVKSSL
jgi:hypothetical protein